MTQSPKLKTALCLRGPRPCKEEPAEKTVYLFDCPDEPWAGREESSFLSAFEAWAEPDTLLSGGTQHHSALLAPLEDFRA